jgi:hypothetical protein
VPQFREQAVSVLGTAPSGRDDRASEEGGARAHWQVTIARNTWASPAGLPPSPGPSLGGRPIASAMRPRGPRHGPGHHGHGGCRPPPPGRQLGPAWSRLAVAGGAGAGGDRNPGPGRGPGSRWRRAGRAVPGAGCPRVGARRGSERKLRPGSARGRTSNTAGSVQAAAAPRGASSCNRGCLHEHKFLLAPSQTRLFCS